MVQYGEAKQLDEIRLPLAQKSLDHSPMVRKSLYTVHYQLGSMLSVLALACCM